METYRVYTVCLLCEKAVWVRVPAAATKAYAAAALDGYLGVHLRNHVDEFLEEVFPSGSHSSGGSSVRPADPNP